MTPGRLTLMLPPRLEYMLVDRPTVAGASRAPPWPWLNSWLPWLSWLEPPGAMLPRPTRAGASDCRRFPVDEVGIIDIRGRGIDDGTGSADVDVWSVWRRRGSIVVGVCACADPSPTARAPGAKQ